MIFNDSDVSKMWEEGANFGFLKLHIEFKDYSNESVNEENLHEGSVGEENVNSQEIQTELPIYDAPIFSNSGEDEDFIPLNSSDSISSDESFIDESQTDDEEQLISIQNKKAVRVENAYDHTTF